MRLSLVTEQMADSTLAVEATHRFVHVPGRTIIVLDAGMVGVAHADCSAVPIRRLPSIAAGRKFRTRQWLIADGPRRFQQPSMFMRQPARWKQRHRVSSRAQKFTASGTSPTGTTLIFMLTMPTCSRPVRSRRYRRPAAQTSSTFFSAAAVSRTAQLPSACRTDGRRFRNRQMLCYQLLPVRLLGLVAGFRQFLPEASAGRHARFLHEQVGPRQNHH